MSEEQKQMNSLESEDTEPTTSDSEHKYRFRTGDQIANRYKVIASLGVGGFAEVYRCQDDRLGRDVAVKVMNEKGSGLEEAQAAARLEHSHIVQVYDISALNDETPFIVFRYVESETLETRLNQAQYRRLTLDANTLRITRQISEALDYAHGQGVIHRDIKPSNIILDCQGNAYLTDFGLAGLKKPPEGVSVHSAHVEHRLSGTIPYMSPEQLKEGKPGDERSDLYSLGVVVYEMLTGQLPYRGRDTGMIVQIATSDPLPPTMANPELPQGIEPVLLRALSKDPGKRYPSCHIFARELEEAARAYVEASDQYEQAKEFFEDKKWRQALSTFKRLESQAPGFKDAAHYLEQAEHQVRLLELYERAKEALKRGEHQGALDTLNVLSQLAPDYDVTDLREQAREGLAEAEKRSLDEQYQQAVGQFEKEEHQACLDTLAVIRERNPDYPDPQGIEALAQEHVERQRHVRTLYSQGVEQMGREQWDDAIATFQTLHEKSPKYEDIETRFTMARHMARMSSLLQEARGFLTQEEFAACIDKLGELERVDTDYKRHEVAQLRKEALSRLCERAKHLMQKEDFEGSLAVLAALRERAPDYPNVEELTAQVQEGIQVRDLRAKLDGMYKQALEHLSRRAYQEALELWQAIQQQKGDLNYPDPRDVQVRARDGLCSSLYNQALGSLAREDPDQALDLWQQIREADPHYPDNQQVEDRANKMRVQHRKAAEREKAIRTWAWRIGGGVALILLIVIAVVVIRACNAVAPTTTPTKTPTPTSTSRPPVTTTEATFTPASPPAPTTPAPTDMPTRTPSPTPEPPTPTPATPSATPTSTPTPTPTPISDTEATVSHPQGASIFAAPASNAQVLGSVSAGEIVEILGRSAYGKWFYIRNARGVEGFAYYDRFEWSGDFESLSVRTSLPPSSPGPVTTTPRALLEMDLWDLPDGWCSGGMWYKRVYIAGHGGDGAYTYYWRGERLAGPLSEGYTFEVHSTGGALIGAGRADSGDGQTVERDLYISPPSCHQ